VDKWEEEFMSEKSITDAEFWEKLENHWKDIAQWVYWVWKMCYVKDVFGSFLCASYCAAV